MTLAIPLDEIKIHSENLMRFEPEQLDSLLGPLMAPRQISLFHCDERAPLTALAHVIAVAGARTGKKAVFLDSGKNYQPKLARVLSDDSDQTMRRLLVADVLGLDVLEEIAPHLSMMKNLSVLVLDSLTGVLNLTGAPGSKGRQRRLFATLETLRTIVNLLGVHLMITDHSQRDWTTGEMRPIGGNVLAHDVDSMVRVARLDTSRDAVHITIERSPQASPEEGVVVRLGRAGLRTITRE